MSIPQSSEIKVVRCPGELLDETIKLSRIFADDNSNIKVKLSPVIGQRDIGIEICQFAPIMPLAPVMPRVVFGST